MTDIPTAYDPSSVEDKWTKFWGENQIFASDVDPDREPYTIVIPPPNITGMLHMGHILNNTLQDIFIRRQRMRGYNACWVPGTDHASIATESKVVAALKEKGLSKEELGREKFLEHCREWREKYGGIITTQLRKLGVSCDWRRERFTMDDDYSKLVLQAFVDLYREGKIVRGYRMVNWDPATRSAISDEEVEYREVNGKLWYFRYPVVGSDEHIVVATTRPETALGDTGVAVNPNDERFKKFIGKNVKLPLVGREIPIFADDYVDPEFGTGAVKITPAHDPNDYEMGKRRSLETVNVLNPDGTMNKNVPGEFVGLDRFEARKLFVKRMEEADLLEKIEDYQTKIGYSQRGGVPIEPYLSEQWFMKMDELAKPALKAAEDGEVKFHPAHWTKTYQHWMEGIRDWCVSRQLWWGHRIPVWTHNETGEEYCDVDPPKDPEKWAQDPDALDTWASSWLWAHGVFRDEKERAYYHPTDTLVTAPDIIFFWVARMIMAGLHFRGEIPFRHVYFTSVIRDERGRKMSKSLGNSPDPLDVIATYGADALRFTVIYLAPLGQDVLFSEEKVEIGRNFANKIWNAGRFLLMNAAETAPDPAYADKRVDFVDRWIDSRFHRSLAKLEAAMEKYEINNASKLLYAYVWNDFCDWYVELIKNKLYSDDEELKRATITRAIARFKDILKLAHPFMPFITEELWSVFEKGDETSSIATSSYPVPDESKIDDKVERDVELLQNVVAGARNIRGEMNIPPSKPIDVRVRSESVPDEYAEYVAKLAKAASVEIDPNMKQPPKSAGAVMKNAEVFVPLEGLIDLDVERARLDKELGRVEGALKGAEKKLGNKKFVDNAPADVVEKAREKKADYEEKIRKLKELRARLED